MVRAVPGLLTQISNLDHVTDIASDDNGVLWVSASDGRVCRVDYGMHQCFGSTDGVPAESWNAILVPGDGHVLVRSATKLLDLDLKTEHGSVFDLPDQDHRVDFRPQYPILEKATSGMIATPARDGILIGRPGHWSVLRNDDIASGGVVGAIRFDRSGNPWVGVAAFGVERAVGYGIWEDPSDGFGRSNVPVWQMSRKKGGSLWLATDDGVVAIDPVPSGPRPASLDGAAYAVSADDSGHVWRANSIRGVSRITLATGETTFYPTPGLDEIISGRNGRVWLLSRDGVWVVDHADGVPTMPRPFSTLRQPVTDGVAAPDGSLWLLSDGQLGHISEDGKFVLLHPDWPKATFLPHVLALADTHTLWISGAEGGLFRLHVSGDQLDHPQQMIVPSVASNLIEALLVDRRGWLWVGSDEGVSVFNNTRWVSAKRASGLASDDVDEDSLLEDPDGSMWVGTSRGLSHLLRPEALFDLVPLHPVISSADFGGALYQQRAVPFTRDPLTVLFGTLDFRAASVMRFRYHLEGVDAGWVETDAGSVRYPSVPYGHHVFSVVAVNPLTQQISAPVSVVIRVHAPWWLWWPLIVLYAVLAAAVLYGMLRLRDLYVAYRQAWLLRAVEARTRELRLAQSIDSLTGLLTRGEVQGRLLAKLASPGRTTLMVVGLLDVDHFKSINDRFGHLAGDDILKEIGRRLQLALATGEQAGRYGGEEILITIEDDDCLGFGRLEELCQAVCDAAFPVEAQTIRVTCSIGATRSRAKDDWKTLIGRADKALYRAKSEGRDRMIIAENDDAEAVT